MSTPRTFVEVMEEIGDDPNQWLPLDGADEQIWVYGELECPICGEVQYSVHAVVSDRLECKCGYMMVNPDRVYS